MRETEQTRDVTQAEPPVLGTRETSHAVKLGYLLFGPLESSL